MSEAREYWILERDEGHPYPYSTGHGALVAQAVLGGEIIHVREVTEEFPGILPQEELGSNFQAELNANLEDLYEISASQPSELEMHRDDHQSVKAAGFECVGELLAAYNVLLAKADHSAALADALEEFITAGDSCVTTDDDWSAMLRFGKAVDAARAAISALVQAAVKDIKAEYWTLEEVASRVELFEGGSDYARWSAYQIRRLKKGE